MWPTPDAAIIRDVAPAPSAVLLPNIRPPVCRPTHRTHDEGRASAEHVSGKSDAISVSVFTCMSVCDGLAEGGAPLAYDHARHADPVVRGRVVCLHSAEPILLRVSLAPRDNHSLRGAIERRYQRHRAGTRRRDVCTDGPLPGSQIENLHRRNGVVEDVGSPSAVETLGVLIARGAAPRSVATARHNQLRVVDKHGIEVVAVVARSGQLLPRTAAWIVCRQPTERLCACKTAASSQVRRRVLRSYR